MKKRKAVSRKLRFEVFKRDSFTCQYCGRKAPDIILEVDHIAPVSAGGKNHVINLITSCEACNRGKGKRKLTDKSVVEKGRKQLEALQRRREQIKMMFQWQEGLAEIEEDTIKYLSEYADKHISGFCINDKGKQRLKQWLVKFTCEEIINAINVSARHYLQFDKEGKLAKEAVEQYWTRIPGICAVTRQTSNNPDILRLYYIRGILRNRLKHRYCDDNRAIGLLKKAHEASIDLDRLEAFVKKVSTWTDFRGGIEEYLGRGADEKNE